MKIFVYMEKFKAEEIFPLIKQFKKIAKEVCKITKQNNRILSSSCMIVDNEQIKAINNERRQIDEVTDVLSFPLLSVVENIKITKKNFPFDYSLDAKTINLGDIYICLERAKEQAIEFGHSQEREICYLFTHGLLHLLGFDHMAELDKTKMRAVEDKVLNKLKITRD